MYFYVGNEGAESKNALQKQYHHHMGAMTYDEWRDTWVSEGVYPTALLGSSTTPSDSTTSTLVSRAGDFFCSMHSRDKKTEKWSIKAPETKEMTDKLLEYTGELVEDKLVPTVEKDPFTLAMGKPYHPGRVLGAGGSLLGWEKVMGPKYTKSGRSQASVNSPQNFDATVASIKEQVRNEMSEEFNAWAKQMNLPTLPFSSTNPADSSSHPRRQGEQEINAREEIGTPSHANSRGLDTPTPHDFPILQE
ncbi:uncharacterized protein LOC110692221 isoform X2 [Chenopodium quinoa]|uniref:uncharacterized protein LOC110692221 isoform X2 n=1 Tax=Chenopodium quinoa TaxID=63459 RepID=UPI000B796928|nr:uncharacterized protein LOC110692221 isoform X2 [Chenopodium quinoa]